MNGLSVLTVLAGAVIILLTLGDAFETIILPRTVKRAFRVVTLTFFLTRIAYDLVGRLRPCTLRQRLAVSFAPLTLFFLIGTWAMLLIVGFAILSAGLHLPFREGLPSFGNRLYFSGTTFFTLGFGDFVPSGYMGKFIAFLEAGTGFAFLALVISYVPVLYSAFSRREQTILLLDSKAGSEPVASEIFKRYAEAQCLDELPALLKEWEQFAAQLLENFLSYPILGYYRSQHDDQSWLNSLTAIMDACALAISCYPGDDPTARKIRFQANQTFVMSRHLVVDFAYVISSDPKKPQPRLGNSELSAIISMLGSRGLAIRTDTAAMEKLTHTRELYEPFVTGLADRLKMDLPPWIRPDNLHDNWETTAWDGSHF